MKPVMVRDFWTKLKSQRRGSAALITTIAISSILVVLFVGITTIATREIRQSINADNASRALYAAEAGVEDASRQLANDPNYTQKECNADALDTDKDRKEVRVSGESDSAWTCRTVSQVSEFLTGRIDKDDVVQIDLSKAKNCNEDSCANVAVQYMSIEWNDPKVDSSTPLGVTPGSLGNNALPAYLTASDNGWDGRAAILELTTTWYNKSGLSGSSLGGGVFPVRTVLASPVCGSSPCTTQDISPLNGGVGCPADGANDQDCSPTDRQAGIAGFRPQSLLSVGCTDDKNASYSCRLPSTATTSSPASAATTYNVSNLTRTEFQVGASPVVSSCDSGSACNTLLRLKARYASASYKLRFYYTDGATGDLKPAYLTDGYATIDVTARSGDYFRRVQAKKKIAPTVFTGVFDSTVFSGSDICKDLTVYKDNAGAPEFKQVAAGSAVQNDKKGRNSCNN